MKTFAIACAVTLAATPVLAQATPPAGSGTASPAPVTPSSDTSGTSATAGEHRGESRPGRGAYIKMQGPGGSEITVRCADGESTRACADVVMQLVERSRTASADRRRDWDRDRDTRSDSTRGSSAYRGERDRDF